MNLVILINGEPYMSKGHIRKYKTINGARIVARWLKDSQYYKDTKIEIGVFSYELLEEVL